MRLDGVRLVAPDPAPVVAAYRRLLAVAPVEIEPARWRFQLERGAVEVVPGDVAAVHTVVTFAAEDGDDLAAWAADAGDHGGLDVLVIAPPAAGRVRASDAAVAAIDHVVVRTGDPERAIAHWRDRLGLRLALDRAFPERKVRLLFFRSGGLTLEYAAPLEGGGTTGPDAVHGVSYRVDHLDAVRARLAAAGIEVSEARPGMKPGSRVVSVRSGTAGVPVLLIQQPPRS